MGFKIYNQNNYPNTLYPSSDLPKATIKSGGCGVTSMSMVVTNFIGINIDPIAMAAYSIKHGARVNGGTDVGVLSKSICNDYGITYKTTNDENQLLSHLKSGGIAIANVSGDRKGWVGVLSSGGHYVVVVSANGNTVKIADPGYYVGKFNKTGRAGKITVDADTLCNMDINVLASDTLGSLTAYYLFSKKETPVVPVSAPILTEIKVNVVGKTFVGFLRDNRSFCPARDIMNALGVTFTWDNSVNSIIVGTEKVPVIIKDSKGYSLVSEIARVTNKNVKWDDPTKTVSIV